MSLEQILRREWKRPIDPELRRVAVRTAFIARFIVLREGRRSRAHRFIEQLTWEATSTATEISVMIRQAFIDNGDRLGPVERDLKRALDHAERSIDHFIQPYLERATLTFQAALLDYQRSNQLLFGDEDKGDGTPRNGGWRIEP